jgi:PGM1 C-terminal domain
MPARIAARTTARPPPPRRSRARRETPATLVAMTRPERARRFAELQRAMPRAWAAACAGREGGSVVVVPSRGVDKWHETPAETQAYEERLLCLLLLLRQPGLHVVYVTSMPVAPAIVDYYLSLLEDVAADDARARLTLLSANDASRRPLSEKLLDRPLLLHRIRRAIPDRELAHLVPYCPTASDCDLALVLGIPMYAADPRHARFGTKSGGRELFAQEGVAHPLGEENVTSLQDAAAAIARIRAARPQVGELVVKLDEGVSGDGNAIVDMRGLPRPGAAGELAGIRRRLRTMAFEAPGASLETYVARLEARGGIVEERIVAPQLRSPSVQLQITPDGEVEVISTHDQLLGGPGGQSFLGCSFPADRAYARAITEQALIVGARLAREGVIGRFAIDFVVVREAAGAWRSYAIEINLRKGGTTHPFLALQLLTGGSYDPVEARFTAPGGGCGHLVATDHLTIAQLRDVSLDELLRIVDRRGLRFDRARGGGVVLHMLSAASGAGRLGLTAIAGTPDEATRLVERVAAVLLEEACAAGAPMRAPARTGGLLGLPALAPG